MRVGLFLAVLVFLGALSGWAATLYEFGTTRERFEVLAKVDTRPTPELTLGGEAQPIAEVVGERDIAMGNIDRNTTNWHSFKIRNAGNAPLKLQLANQSCGQCVQPDFVSDVVAPGEETTIRVAFITRKPGPEFKESFEIRTNDPNRQMLTFIGRGIVIQPLRTNPAEVTMGSVSATEGGSGSFHVLSFRGPTLEILEHRFSDPSTAEYFELSAEPAAEAEVKRVPYAVSGLHVTVRVKPGLPLGPISQSVHLKVQADPPKGIDPAAVHADEAKGSSTLSGDGSGVTDTAGVAELDVPIRGTVVSDISLLGAGNFKSDISTLFLGTVKKSEVKKANLHVLVKGPHREAVKLSVQSVDPAGLLSVEIGEPKIISDGAVYMYPLTVEIQPGAVSVNRLGFEGNPPGKILIETTHPEAKQVQLFVRFATADNE